MEKNNDFIGLWFKLQKTIISFLRKKIIQAEYQDIRTNLFNKKYFQLGEDSNKLYKSILFEPVLLQQSQNIISIVSNYYSIDEIINLMRRSILTPKTFRIFNFSEKKFYELEFRQKHYQNSFNNCSYKTLITVLINDYNNCYDKVTQELLTEETTKKRHKYSIQVLKNIPIKYHIDFFNLKIDQHSNISTRKKEFLKIKLQKFFKDPTNLEYIISSIINKGEIKSF